MKISIVVPCYNEEDSLPLFKERFDGIAAQMEDVVFELLFIDDGSTDQTLSLCHRLASGDARIRVISLSRNFGKEAALLAGLSQASGDLVSMMDVDLQDPPELLPAMLSVMRDTACDCVAAKRVTRAGEPPVRSFFARLFYRLMHRISDVRVEDGVRDFRLMRREVADAILSLPEKRRFSKGLMAWVGFDIRYIAYENVERVAGETKFSFWGLFRYAIEGITSLTSAPAGMPYLFAGLCSLGFVLLMIRGVWTAALLCALSACVLTGIGVLGSYIARVFWETKKRPLYIFKKDDHDSQGMFEKQK